MREYEYYVDDFENLLNFYLNKGFVFVGLRDLIKKTYPKNKKIVCLTFDDGYRDFKELVVPLLERYQIPATVYLVPNYIDRSQPKWDYVLDFVISECRDISDIETNFPFVHSLVSDQNFNDLSEVFEYLKLLFKEANSTDSFYLINNFCNSVTNHTYRAGELMLNVDEIKQIANSQYVNIGSHSQNHFVMTALSASQLDNEIKAKIHLLSELTGQRIEHFSYPYGAASTREFKAIKGANYQTATTTICRSLRKYTAEDPIQLPRYVVRINDRPDDFVRWIRHGEKR